MAEASVDIPKVGKVKKLYVWVAIGGMAAFVGWRYYTAARSAGSEAPPVTGDVGAPVDASGIIGAGGGGGNIQYAGTTTQSDPAVIADNQQWTARAVELLSAAGFDPASVYAALGDFLARRPLDATEQRIVTSAIAAVGQPPVGGPYSIIPQVGVVSMTAPTGLKAVAINKTSVDFTCNPVPGAAFYYLYRSGITDNISGGRDTKLTASGLSPGKTYKFAVAAAATTGKVGPKSSYITVTTKK